MSLRTRSKGDWGKALVYVFDGGGFHPLMMRLYALESRRPESCRATSIVGVMTPDPLAEFL